MQLIRLFALTRRLRCRSGIDVSSGRAMVPKWQAHSLDNRNQLRCDPRCVRLSIHGNHGGPGREAPRLIAIGLMADMAGRPGRSVLQFAQGTAMARWRKRPDYISAVPQKQLLT